jgi:hypothetical protein
MDHGTSIILPALIGALLLFIFFALVIAVSRAIGRRSDPRSLKIVEQNGCYTIAGKALACSHCGGGKFREQQVLLNTWLMSLLRVDWLDSSATVLSCENCNKLTWFAQSPPRKN